MAPHAALAEIGVDYRLVEIGREEAQEDESYRAINPLGVVPTLFDSEQGLVLTESAAILLYLGDRFPESKLAPADRADYFRWLVFLTNTVQTAMLRFFYPERYGSGDDVAATAARDAQEAFDILDRALEDQDMAGRRASHRCRPLPLHGHALGTPPRAGRLGEADLRRHFLATLELPGVAPHARRAGARSPRLGRVKAKPPGPVNVA